ncbi:flagellar hook-length control protein FliK [Azospirillum halopraeferens]|uniref:flagellar hook-length control protein FliK n=1 Tax=Azospirillum halopraeferens TaxID=34010 RepID=UPI0003FF71D8|nr:flagellar hook-length control protein FliK [Azospirillum halopraeferens]
MTRMTDVVTPPSRPAAETRAAATRSGDGADADTFDGLLGGIGADGDGAEPDAADAAPGPRPDTAAAVVAAITADPPAAWLSAAPTASPPAAPPVPPPAPAADAVPDASPAPAPAAGAGGTAAPPPDAGRPVPPPGPAPVAAPAEPDTAAGPANGTAAATNATVAPDAPGTAATTVPAAVAPAAVAGAGAGEAVAEPRRTERTTGRTAGRTAGTMTADTTDPRNGGSAAGRPAAPPPSGGDGAFAGSGDRPPLPFTAAPATAAGPDTGAADGLAPASAPATASQHAAATAGAGARAPGAGMPGQPMAQLSEPLVRIAAAGGGSFRIELSPAELGRVRVVAEVIDGQVTLVVRAEHADTLALLRRDVQVLEKALGDAGLTLDTAGLQFSLEGDGGSRGSAAFDQGSGRQTGLYPPAALPGTADPAPDRALRPIDGLVDLIV